MDIILNKRDLNGKAAVYVAWGRARECLYVGMTSQGLLRPFTNSVLRSVWDRLERIAIEWCANSDIARRREGELITKLNPLLNKVGRFNAMDNSRFAESETLKSAMSQAKGNKLEAARILGISRATLYRRLGGKRISFLQSVEE